MSSNDEAITQGRKRRKLIALSSIATLLLFFLVYFSWLFLTKGYSFNVAPSDASKAATYAVTSGNGFFIGDKLYVVGGDASATISAPRYQPLTIQINAGSPSIIDLELTPLPARVVIKTAPEVEGITWSINGTEVQVAKSLETDLEAGTYSIIASHPSYESGSTTIQADTADEINDTIILTPMAGTISIQSKPAGARVSMDGEALGVTPLSLSRPGGQYEVVVTKDGYEPLRDVIKITKRRSEPTRNYRLQAVQASVQADLSPRGGALLLNGKPVTNPVSVDANTLHTVRYERAGYLPQEQRISLKPGEESRLSFELAPEIGEVNFTANKRAEVHVNGVFKGTTPLKIDMQALESSVEFKRDSYRTVTKTFKPSSKTPTQVKANMLKEFEARRREGKPLFVDTLGIEMAKVTPRKFIMGSRPNEKGRQRNEHPVSVDFTRSIWVSRHEITEAQFNAFKQQNGTSKLPMTNISWEEAAAYTNWLSQKEGLLPFYIIENNRVVGINKQARGYRLPTEAEWEFIAKLNRRARPTTFVWGTIERIRDKQGNFADAARKGQQTFILKDYNDGFGGKAPVGSFKADRGGFYDLDGNVKEWMHDLYSVTPPETNITHIDYLGVQRGTAHVVKGASFKTGRMKNLRASVREGESGKADDIGFRIARYDR